MTFRTLHGLEVITRLLSSDEPVTFEGNYFQLRGATLLPRPQRPAGPRILIGGNLPQRTLPLVARFANVWNAVALSASQFRERSEQLDQLLREQERQPGDVKRSMMMMVIFGRTNEELGAVIDKLPFDYPELAGKSLREKIIYFREHNVLIGNGEEIAEQITALGEAGVEEIMSQWFHIEDIDRLRDYAEDVLPRIDRS